MYDIKCPFDGCNLWLHGQKEYDQHLLKVHGSYPTGMTIAEETEKDFDSITANVYQIMLTVPSACNDDGILFISYLRQFPQALVYDYNTKLITFKDKEGISYQDLMKAFRCLESVSRARRLLQEQAFLRIDAGNGTETDHLICPTEKVQLRRRLRESAMRRKLAKKDE